jgi:hypothetical protein
MERVFMARDGAMDVPGSHSGGSRPDAEQQQPPTDAMGVV